MKKITAYREWWVIGFIKWHDKSLENAEEVFMTEVTEWDYNRLKENINNYTKEKVAKLLRDRPFEK